MSLLRNFSPGGSEPDDNEPTTDEQTTTPAQPDETAPPGGQAPGTARYAFAAPGAGAAPAPVAVVPSEVITEPDEPAEESERDDRAEQIAPAPAAEAPAPEAPAPEAAPVPSFTPAPEAFAPEAAAPEAFAPEAAAPEALPYKAPVPDPAPGPDVQTAPVPVPSPRATGEGEPGGQPGPVTQPDFAAPLLSGTAELRARWQRVQGDFVDDPQAAVSAADDLVGQTAEALVNAVRQRQRQLRAAWERDPAHASPTAADGRTPTAMAPGAPDTEQLRLMMQRYRALFNELCRPS
jgi:hypothetical protein